MADAWSGPLANTDTPTEEFIRTWRNQNAFAARCLEAGIAGWDDYATRQLRAALEENNTTDPKQMEFQILAATEWVIHSGRTLLRWSKEDDDGESYDEDVTPRSMFDGKPGLSPKRWGFWRYRFKELCKEQGLVSQDAQVVVNLAVERMDEAETWYNPPGSSEEPLSELEGVHTSSFKGKDA